MRPLTLAAQFDLPLFTVPVRWTLRLLAWVAFGVSGYLAWHVVTHTPVAGCGVGSEAGCDMVLGSTWSKWLGVPVAVPGFACYATLAALSVLLGVKDPRAGRWINTAFLMMALVAALASLWFLAVQVFAIGHFCPYCIVADLCGIAIGAVAAWCTARWLRATRHLRSSRTTATGVMALRTALPTAPRSAPLPVGRQLPTPSLYAALGGAGAIVVLLVGGQVLFPAKSYEMQQVALSESIEMNGADGEERAEPRPTEPDARVAMRVPPELSDDDAQVNRQADSGVITARYEEPAGEQTQREPPADPPASAAAADEEPASAESAAPSSSEPRHERLVKFLGGKLTLDVYKHPLIGSPQAPHVIVEMVSYNCKHCRATHRTVKQALARFGDQVAVIVMVIPFERGCNKLITSSAGSHRGACATARMALGIASIKPSAFAKFHDWLMADEEDPPPLDSVVARAYGLVNRERLRDLSRGEELEKQIARYVNLFAALRNQNSGNKEFGLPVQILGDHVMTGTVEKPADLYHAWEKHLGVKPR